MSLGEELFRDLDFFFLLLGGVNIEVIRWKGNYAGNYEDDGFEAVGVNASFH